MKPWPHQAAELEQSGLAPARALLWDMRTGKTRATIDTACLMYVSGMINGLLVLAPNGVHSNWSIREIPKHGWEGCNIESVIWRASAMHRAYTRDALIDQVEKVLKHKDFKMLGVNTEGLMHPKAQALIKEFYAACDNKVLVVFDESHAFRRPGAKRTRLARGLARRSTARRILSGTAVLNSPLHAFSQFELLEKGALGFTRFKDFKERYTEIGEHSMIKGGRRVFYETIEGYRNQEELRERMASWSSVILREDVEGLPDVQRIEISIPLSKAQREAYLTILESRNRPTTANKKPPRIKLWNRDYWQIPIDSNIWSLCHQVLGGFVYDQTEVMNIEENPPRLQILAETVEEIGGSFIVWANFKEDIRRVVLALKRIRSCSVVEYHGSISNKKRERAINRFQSGDANVFVGHPLAAGEGLDLSAADTVIWYGHTMKNAIVRHQADQRASAVGGRQVTVLDFIADGTIDEEIIAGIQAKADMAEWLSRSGLQEALLERSKGII